MHDTCVYVCQPASRSFIRNYLSSATASELGWMIEGRTSAGCCDSCRAEDSVSALVIFNDVMVMGGNEALELASPFVDRSDCVRAPSSWEVEGFFVFTVSSSSLFD